jgi:hypothetical protein
VRSNSLTVWLNGNNVTAWTSHTQYGFSLTPRNPLGPGSHTVRVTGVDNYGVPFERSWSFTVNAPVNSPVQLRNQEPAPGSQISNLRPRIAANFTAPVNVASVSVVIDVTNVTGWTEKSQTRIAMTPHNPLTLGSHTVHVAGRDARGASFERQWSFVAIAGPPPRPTPAKPHLTIGEPAPNQVVPPSFTLKGNTVANGRVNVVAGANPGGSANFSGQTVAGPLGNFSLAVTIKQLAGQQTTTLTITATNPVNSQTIEKRLTVRLIQPR